MDMVPWWDSSHDMRHGVMNIMSLRMTAPFVNLFMLLVMLLNDYRNHTLAERGFKAPTAYKTGTTIVGLIYKVRYSILLGT